jgi:hypothetical protein
MAAGSINCIYCGATNPAGTSRCVSCGAPIDIPVTPPVRVTVVNTPTPPVTIPPQSVARADTTPEQINDAVDAAPLSDQLKDGLKTAAAGLGTLGAGTLGVGTFIARTAAEAAAIALSAVLLGYFSAANGSFLLGLLGGMVIGLLVGSVVKRPIGALLSAPFGTIAGLVAARFLQPSLPGWPMHALLGLTGGALFALLGGRRGSTTGVVKWYTRLRPLLGLAGGFLFGLLGAFFGASVH